MTRKETESMLRYMLSMYPNVKMTEQQLAYSVNVWAEEFKSDSCESVAAAFRLARAESPDWMPTVPKIQNAIRQIASTVRVKSKEQEFKDSHCGYSKEEWDKIIAWENSPEGAAKLVEYRKRLNEITGEES
jgi:hypothetical protein